MQQCKIYMARNRPVMFKGAAKEWPAASKWTLDFFREGAMGDTMVTVSLDGKVESFSDTGSCDQVPFPFFCCPVVLMVS